MAITNRISISWSDGGNTIGGVFTRNPGEELVINEEVPALSTNMHLSASIDVSQMLDYVLMADGDDMTLKTNSTSAPAATINLVDGVPLVWNSTGGYPSIANSAFGSTDVTSIWVTSTAGGTLHIAVGTDPTP